MGGGRGLSIVKELPENRKARVHIVNEHPCDMPHLMKAETSYFESPIHLSPIALCLYTKEFVASGATMDSKIPKKSDLKHERFPMPRNQKKGAPDEKKKCAAMLHDALRCTQYFPP